MTMYRCDEGNGGSKESGVLQPVRIQYLPYVAAGNVCEYPSSLYGTKMYLMVLSNHYSVESHTKLTWSCDEGTITELTQSIEIGNTTTQAVKYEGNGTLTLLRKSGNNNVAVVGIACTPQYDNFDLVGIGNGGKGSCTVDISDYGNDFILWGVQFDYQCTSKLTIATNDPGVTINPYMSPLYLGYSRGAISAYHIKSSGTGTLTVSWTANSNGKLGTTRIMVLS